MSLTNSNIFTMKLKGLLLLSGLLLSTITLSMNGSYQRVNADGDFIYGEKIDNPGATYRTQRVWLNNENTYFYDNDEWGVPCKNAIRYSIDNTYYVIEMETAINTSDSRKYYYADIPYQVRSASFLRISGSEDHLYRIYQEANIDYLSYGICYYAGTSSPDDYSNIRISSVMNADAYILARVVESYLTYGKDDSNGTTKSTVKALYSTWFSNKKASKDELKNTKILDYTGYAANGNSYEGLEKNAYFSINEKWNTMCSQAGIDPNTGLDRNDFLEWIKQNKVIIIVGGIAILGIVGFAIFLVIKKKKANQ